MDYLEYGYREIVRWKQDSDDTIMIRWYRAAPGARVFTEPNAFGSHVWDDADLPKNQGVGSLRMWKGWSPSINPLYPGTGDVDHPEWFLTGVPPGQCLGELCTHADLGLGGQVRVVLQRVSGRLALQASYQLGARTFEGRIALDGEYLQGAQLQAVEGRVALDAEYVYPAFEGLLALNGEYDSAPLLIEGHIGLDGEFDAAPLLIEGRIGLDGEYDSAEHGSETYTGSGTWAVPPGITSVILEAYGGSGSAPLNLGGFSGGGGGGGYAMTTLSVSPGDTLTYLTGSLCWVSSTGGQPSVPAGGVLASSGSNAGYIAGGAGGTFGVGDFTAAGGNGGGTNPAVAGGGGGGGGGPSGAGGAGGNPVGTTGGAGGTSPDGYTGGAGGNNGFAGVTGVPVGGGAGGNGPGSSGQASGWPGYVRITW